MNAIQNVRYFAGLLSVLLVAFMTIGGCGGSGDDDDEHHMDDTFDLTITLLNDQSNTEPVHILSPGESMGPENELFPGESRDVFLGGVEIDEVILFRAGRQGVICETVQCVPLGTGQPLGDFFLVVWNEPDPGLELILDCDEGFAGDFGSFGTTVCPLPPVF